MAAFLIPGFLRKFSYRANRLFVDAPEVPKLVLQRLCRSAKNSGKPARHALLKVGEIRVDCDASHSFLRDPEMPQHFPDAQSTFDGTPAHVLRPNQGENLLGTLPPCFFLL